MSVTAQGLASTIQYFKGLGNRVERAQAKAISSPGALSKMKAMAHDEMDSIVYSVYSPTYYERTDAMKDQIVATSAVDGAAEVGLPLDNNLKSIAGDSKGENTYAMFMLPEYAADSFFKGSAASSIPRDFLTAWHNLFGEELPKAIAEALEQELSK